MSDARFVGGDLPKTQPFPPEQQMTTPLPEPHHDVGCRCLPCTLINIAGCIMRGDYRAPIIDAVLLHQVAAELEALRADNETLKHALRAERAPKTAP